MSIWEFRPIPRRPLALPFRSFRSNQSQRRRRSSRRPEESSPRRHSVFRAADVSISETQQATNSPLCRRTESRDGIASSSIVSVDSECQDPELLRRLLRAKDRMDAASHEDWPVQRLARVSRVSKAHCARSFKQAFGVPPHRYLLTRRLERATALLRDTGLTITEIAFQTGWNSLGTFGRTFRDVTGESPGELRAREKATPHDQIGRAH